MSIYFGNTSDEELISELRQRGFCVTSEVEVSGCAKCDGCGYISKEHEDGDACPFCDGGKMETVVA